MITHGPKVIWNADHYFGQPRNRIFVRVPELFAQIGR